MRELNFAVLVSGLQWMIRKNTRLDSDLYMSSAKD